jgi:Arc/MetJ-type ribon-helix-helix transcriptional regulator
MAIQLTAEQEQRIQAVVDAGAYPSTHEALDAALTAVETAAAPDFDGSGKELEGQLLKALDSKEMAEEEFWDTIDRDTNALLAARKTGPRA